MRRSLLHSLSQIVLSLALVTLTTRTEEFVALIPELAFCPSRKLIGALLVLIAWYFVITEILLLPGLVAAACVIVSALLCGRWFGSSSSEVVVSQCLTVGLAIVGLMILTGASGLAFLHFNLQRLHVELTLVTYIAAGLVGYATKKKERAP